MTSFPSPAIPAGVAAPVLTAIAESVGTPAYVYDAAEIRRAYTTFDRALVHNYWTECVEALA